MAYTNLLCCAGIKHLAIESCTFSIAQAPWAPTWSLDTLSVNSANLPVGPHLPANLIRSGTCRSFTFTHEPLRPTPNYDFSNLLDLIFVSTGGSLNTLELRCSATDQALLKAIPNMAFLRALKNLSVYSSYSEASHLPAILDALDQANARLTSLSIRMGVAEVQKMRDALYHVVMSDLEELHVLAFETGVGARLWDGLRGDCEELKVELELMRFP